MRPALFLLLLLTAAAPPDGARRYMVTGFDRIRIDGPFEIDVTPGSSAATAEGETGALDRLSVRVEGSTLIVSAATAGFDRRAANTPVRVRIATPQLRAAMARGGGHIHIAEMRGPRVDVSLEGIGSLDVTDIRTDDFNAVHYGMGLMKLAGTAGQARIRGAVGGTIDATAFVAGNATLLWESMGPLTIGVRYTAQITASGQGPVTIIGKPYCVIRGTAQVTCEGNVQRR